MNCFRYKIEHDYGFAPNPFHGTLSLATCKGPIRQNKNLQVGDWIVGFGSKSMDNDGYLIYAMKVERIITFDEYWESEEFQCKKPVINGTLVQMYGDMCIIPINLQKQSGNLFRSAVRTVIKTGQ